MSISMIRAQNPQGVVYAGHDLDTKAVSLDEQIGEQVRALNQLKENWSGSAANAAVATAYRNIQQQYWQHEKLAALAKAMQSGGASLVAVRDVLLTWVDIASTLFDVSDAGVVTAKPPNDTAPWVAIAASYTKIIQQLIESFLTTDQTVSKGIGAINAGWLPGNNPLPGGIDPDSLNSEQVQWLQSLAGSGAPKTGEGGVGVPNTDLSIMGMTPDGRMFTIQGDTATNMGTGGGPGPRSTEGGHNNIIFWKMDEHGKWVVDEVVNDPFPNTPGDVSTIPTSTFNVDDTMYTSVMNVDKWNPKAQGAEPGWVTRSSELWKSVDGGRTWTKAGPVWENAAGSDPFQVQSFAPADDGYVYMYGSENGRANDGMHVARVPVADIGTESKYEYWNGTTFQTGQSSGGSPPVLQPPAGFSGVGEPNVHFYDNKALLTFNDNKGNLFTSSSTDGVNWTAPQLVTSQPGAYGVFQSPLSGNDSVDASVSLWNPYGTELIRIENADTRGLGQY
ncbi:DUF4185 domain-containing protein [Mycobacterium sp. 236(2023)]|uniref:DUF4185 domain-containing protein n=1 Tax=Mycobacterium sp. 236(2023) TaxID=3038163 RepID=UPI0024152C61|nr:DUF4185 domain-containing protein [Mycobacterium sp. 236(2023)]MDG4665830.1 DUF4185 domain-containing protein [Mycobacterium sp. 236(2023)]